MDVKLKETNIVFIEETVFLTDGFYQFLKQLVAVKGLKIYIEKNIQDSIENYKKVMHEKEAYILEGLIDIIEGMGLLHRIDTKGYFVINEFLEVIKSHPNAYALVVTQKESIFETFSKIKEELPSVEIAKFQNQELMEWLVAPKNHNDAFYIEKDRYINKIDIANLDYVYSPKYGHLKLNRSKKYVGGEGIIYGTYNQMMCKLYNHEHLTYINYKKIENMLNYDIYNPKIVWPKDLLFYKNDFVGYLMDEIIGGKTLDELRINMFEGYSIIERYILSYQLLLNIDYLHKKNIIIGDLKLDNIVVVSPKEVYLVDCGCYQIGDYACDVCHPEYTKKIYTSEELKRKLRTIEDEYFPINKIIFEILIGKNPNYNRYNAEVNIENKSGFYFPLDLNEIKELTPEMQLWGVLSKRMREFFYYYFKENKVTYISEWIDELKIFIDTAIKQKERR